MLTDIMFCARITNVKGRWPLAGGRYLT